MEEYCKRTTSESTCVQHVYENMSLTNPFYA
jgi:hypothetical protein